jgi:class 3 adenylate cyclase
MKITALEKITRFRHVIDIIVEELEGKIIQYYGDGCLVLFNSATDAVEFAKLLQTDFNEEPKVPVRIGIHMGDVLIRDGNVFGDVVNIASRIQALSPPVASMFLKWCIGILPIKKEWIRFL